MTSSPEWARTSASKLVCRPHADQRPAHSRCADDLPGAAAGAGRPLLRDFEPDRARTHGACDARHFATCASKRVVRLALASVARAGTAGGARAACVGLRDTADGVGRPAGWAPPPIRA